VPVPESTQPINRPVVRHVVFAHLRAWIEDGTLVPGEVIRDVRIAERLGVSRTPVREALQMLEHLGAIEAVAGRHTRITLVDPADAPLVLRPLSLLHGLAAELAAPKVTKNDLKALVTANERLAKAVADGDPIAAREADNAFHRVILDRAGNRYLSNAVDPLQHQARRLDSLYFLRLDLGVSIGEHEQIIEALREGDAAAARQLTERNMLHNSVEEIGNGSSAQAAAPDSNTS
jgi:DNA-binding GntR family transcriptional regulator